MSSTLSYSVPQTTRGFTQALGKPRLLYILAASHSGSTLTAMLLGTHPQVCTVGELKLSAMESLETYRCSCRAKIAECKFWKSVCESMWSRGHDFDLSAARTDVRQVRDPYIQRLLKPLVRGRISELLRDAALGLSPSWRKLLAETQERNTALVESILALTGKRVIVDSSKVGIRLKYLLRNPSLDIRVLRVVRDGRAVSLTYMDPARFADAQNPALRGGGSGHQREAEKMPMQAAARQWLRSNEEAEHVLAGLEKRQWLQVRYEDLCADPRQVLSSVFEFLGVDPGWFPETANSANFHVTGNGMRLDWDGRISFDERWRSALSASDLATFDAIAGVANRRLGYS